MKKQNLLEPPLLALSICGAEGGSTSAIDKCHRWKGTPERNWGKEIARDTFSSHFSKLKVFRWRSGCPKIPKCQDAKIWMNYDLPSQVTNWGRGYYSWTVSRLLSPHRQQLFPNLPRYFGILVHLVSTFRSSSAAICPSQVVSAHTCTGPHFCTLTAGAMNCWEGSSQSGSCSASRKKLGSSGRGWRASTWACSVELRNS